MFLIIKRDKEIRDSMYSKNDIVKLTIDDIGNDGEGIGHIDGYALFVKDSLPGDVIEAKIIKVKKKMDEI